MNNRIITLTKAELVGTILIAAWIITSIFIPLPAVSSLGY